MTQTRLELLLDVNASEHYTKLLMQESLREEKLEQYIDIVEDLTLEQIQVLIDEQKPMELE